MRRVRALVMTLAVLAAGCASSTKSSEWTKADATPEQVERDRSECLLQARQITPSPDGPRMRMDYPRYERCMTARGYSAAAK